MTEPALDPAALADFLGGVQGFDTLEADDLERAIASAGTATFEPGQFLMRRGEKGDSMYVLVDGRVEVPVFDDSGRMRVVAKLDAGDVVGEMALLTGERRRADVQAETHVQALVFRREVLMPMLAEYPPLARFLTEILGRRLDEAGGIRHVGKYRLLEKIGQGATAKVYEAVHPGLNRVVAVKMLGHELAHDQRFRDRFLNEARLIAGLDHPNIIRVYDTERAYATWFIVMEKVDGSDLFQVLADRGPLDPAEAADILRQLADALEYAHSCGIVHRDVKPANVAVGPDGTVTLMDFGIARRVPAGATRSESVEGTPRYLAPEACLGRAADGRADIYALGVIAFEMLTGRPLFVGRTVREILEAHVGQPPPDVGRLRADVPEGLIEFVRGALIKDPDERLADWNRIRRLLAIGEPIELISHGLEEERILRLRYPQSARARVDDAEQALRRSLRSVRGMDIAGARLVDDGAPAAASRSETVSSVEQEPASSEARGAEPGLLGRLARLGRRGGLKEPAETRMMGPEDKPEA